MIPSSKRRLLAMLVLSSLPVLPRASAAQDEGESWDVNAAHGPTDTVAFTTAEGTWMNVDVSPDGRTLVFDLMGDLYRLPVSGGRATRLTSGPAYDVQPRFSPDGARISFTSDRSGGDNIWTMAADGTDLEQVTDEDFRLLNNAAWTPDGQYLVARKHFTSTRSLGAGEMWMYHISGGAGIQLTERKNDQQDAGEPDVSPDGRYVLFSEDMTPGPTFQYNKDPNPGIYAIRQLDRDTGDLTTLISGPGGAVRPRTSPDGRYVAFVRRVRLKSVLFVYDRETGAERPVFDGMSHDQQEAWAIFGPYPGYGWTPDSREVVFWAQGRLWRVDVHSRDVREIVFEAEVEQAVTAAVRFATDVSPERFEARMIRGATASPDGSWLVFEAVGSLWKKRLPDGRPERLTRDDGHWEQDPSFSPDGTRIVYTTWSDDALGSVRTVALAGGPSRPVTERPGYYETPQYAPDGSRIVYQRGTGNVLLGTLHGVEPGLYHVAAEGGEPRFVIREGREPRFTPDGARIAYLTGGGLSKEYKSVELDGDDPRTHFTLEYATTVVPSPDGAWVAFNDHYNGYIAPFPRLGEPIALHKDTEAVPVTRVTRDVGTDLHWSADSRTLHWMVGPEYFTRDVSEAFSFVEGAPAELPEPDSVGVPVGLTVETDVPSGTVALSGGRLVTMDGDEVIEDGTIVVERNRIVAVGPRASVAVPDGAHVIDVSGHTVLPGIVDAHAHGIHFGTGPMPQRNWAYYANLAYGVTTNHDPSANTGTVFSQSERVRAGRTVGPRIFSTGRILYGADGDFRAVVNTLDDARSHLRRLKAVGAFSVKSYNQPRREQRQQILQAARELEMLVVPEGGSTFYANMTMILDGHTGIEHNVPVAPLYEDVMGVWRETEVGYTPTLVVSYGGMSGEHWLYAHEDVWENERLLTFVPRGIVDSRARRRQKAPDDDYWHVQVATEAAKLVEQGVSVQVGAHGQMQGLAAHWELWMLAQGGMPNHEALRSATLRGAAYLGLDGDLGSLEVGKLADLMVVVGNPLEDLHRSADVRYTMVNGRIFDAVTMHEVGNHPGERGAFWWERPEVDDTWVWRE